ncbi:hypothetical protein LZ32DRAFT_205764 [Colletotrichum eremochloae]|nr:hypothetical protein LZ32DRAFT_205764 [Colletotrichum eremochloae]
MTRDEYNTCTSSTSTLDTRLHVTAIHKDTHPVVGNHLGLILQHAHAITKKSNPIQPASQPARPHAFRMQLPDLESSNDDASRYASSPPSLHDRASHCIPAWEQLASNFFSARLCWSLSPCLAPGLLLPPPPAHLGPPPSLYRDPKLLDKNEVLYQTRREKKPFIQIETRMQNRITRP